MSPIRVLQVVTQMNRAGMESRIMDLYRAIDKEKIQFDFYTCRKAPGAFDGEIIELGGKVYYNSPLSLKSPGSVSRRFKNFLENHPEYRIVHCHLNQWCGVVLLGAERAGIPVRIAHSRTALEKKGLKNCVKNVIKLPVNSTATHKFAVSKKAGVWLFGEEAVSKNEVVIWPNGIKCDRFKFSNEMRMTVRKKLDIGNSFVLIHVGNIRPEKNHQFLLKIFDEVKRKEADAKLLLIGADCMNGIIQNQAKSMNIFDDILFLGSRSDVNELLQAGDVFVFPSFYEGFPGAVLEAEASGLPCIISDTITDEVVLTEFVKKYSIKESARKWADEIITMRAEHRENASCFIKEKGYDVHKSAQQLQEFYFTSLLGNNWEKRV